MFPHVPNPSNIRLAAAKSATEAAPEPRSNDTIERRFWELWNQAIIAGLRTPEQTEFRRLTHLVIG